MKTNSGLFYIDRTELIVISRALNASWNTKDTLETQHIRKLARWFNQAVGEITSEEYFQVTGEHLINES